MSQLAKELFGGEEGATLVDFVMIIAVIGIVSTFASAIAEKFTSITNAISGN